VTMRVSFPAGNNTVSRDNLASRKTIKGRPEWRAP
jgi:hypothetical protein